MIDPLFLRMGTRGSVLARTQAQLVRDHLISSLPSLSIETVIVKTTGDLITDRPLRDVGGKALFIKELEEALLAQDIDMAVHSLKDVEMPLQADFNLPFCLPRSDPRDVLISQEGQKLKDLSLGARVGTCSPRRKAQLLNLRPDLNIVSLRGNVDTRLQKLKRGEMEAICIAYAGLLRLDLEKECTEILDVQQMLPAVAQGVVVIEICKNRTDLEIFLKTLTHLSTTLSVQLERHFLKGFGGDCSTPIAALAQPSESHGFSFTAQVLTPEGTHSQKNTLTGSFEDLFPAVFELGQEYKQWYMHHLTSPSF